jgi:SAM-dependent methyltransferase
MKIVVNKHRVGRQIALDLIVTGQEYSQPRSSALAERNHYAIRALQTPPVSAPPDVPFQLDEQTAPRGRDYHFLRVEERVYEFEAQRKCAARRKEWMISLSTLEELPLDVKAGDLAAAIQPFSCIDESAWTSAVRLRKARLLRRISKRLARKLKGRGNRDRTKISAEYEAVWSAGYDRYDINRAPERMSPWLFRSRHLMASAAGAARFRSILLGAVLSKLHTSSVLEVGCGNGINLLLLAGAFPNVSFTGLELTEAGHAAAKALQKETKLPSHILNYMPLAQLDCHAFRRISFIRGDAAHMPFGEGAFDLVLTVLSIEQMQRIRDQALREMVRVSKGFVLNLEPFQEVNRGFWRYLNILSRDYYRGSIDDLANYGLEPIWATTDFPQELMLGTGLVLSRKTTGS